MTWQQEIDIAVDQERQRANEIQKLADSEKARADEEKARADKYEKMLKDLGKLQQGTLAKHLTPVDGKSAGVCLFRRRGLVCGLGKGKAPRHGCGEPWTFFLFKIDFEQQNLDAEIVTINFFPPPSVCRIIIRVISIRNVSGI